MIDTYIDFKDVYRHIVANAPDTYEALGAQTSSDWFVSNNENYQCFFAHGAYHCILNSPNSYYVSVLPKSHLTNFAVQVEMSILAGNGGGLVFRTRENGSSGYRLFYGRPHTDLVCDRHSLFYACGKYIPPLQTYSQFTIIAHENDLLVYIDGECIVHRQDDTARAGSIGLLIVHFADYDPTHIAFRNLRIWKHLPSLSVKSSSNIVEEAGSVSQSSCRLPADAAAFPPDEKDQLSRDTIAQAQISLTRLLVEELSSTLHYEREEKSRQHAELLTARQKIDELTRINQNLRLQLQAALHKPSSTPDEGTQSQLSQKVGPDNSPPKDEMSPEP